MRFLSIAAPCTWRVPGGLRVMAGGGVKIPGEGNDGNWFLAGVMTVPYEMGENVTGEEAERGTPPIESVLSRFSSGSNEASTFPKVAIVSLGTKVLSPEELDLWNRFALMIELKVWREGSAWLVLRVKENKMTFTTPGKQTHQLRKGFAAI